MKKLNFLDGKYCIADKNSSLKSLEKEYKNSHIIVTGDFNDEPDNISLKKYLASNNYFDQENSNLVNLAYNLKAKEKIGTCKYKGTWFMFDQFVVLKILLDKKQNIYCTLNNIEIFNPDFLLEEDKNYVGYKPFRTYSGYKYNNGFSDHLPVYLDLRMKK